MNALIKNTVVVGLFCASTAATAGGSLQHLGESLNHSAQAVAHSTAAGVKIVSGVVSIPLMAVGEVGKVSGEIGEELWNEANTTLPISETVLTANPSPKQVMNEEKE